MRGTKNVNIYITRNVRSSITVFLFMMFSLFGADYKAKRGSNMRPLYSLEDV